MKHNETKVNIPPLFKKGKEAGEGRAKEIPDGDTKMNLNSIFPGNDHKMADKIKKMIKKQVKAEEAHASGSE